MINREYKKFLSDNSVSIEVVNVLHSLSTIEEVKLLEFMIQRLNITRSNAKKRKLLDRFEELKAQGLDVSYATVNERIFLEFGRPRGMNAGDLTLRLCTINYFTIREAVKEWYDILETLFESECAANDYPTRQDLVEQSEDFRELYDTWMAVIDRSIAKLDPIKFDLLLV